MLDDATELRSMEDAYEKLHIEYLAQRAEYDKKLIKWVNNHYWDSLEKDKHLILRHLRTFTGDIS